MRKIFEDNYFFVNYCLKIWWKYIRWKKPAKFHGNIYNCKKYRKNCGIICNHKNFWYFSAYFFVNFCLKIWKNYTRWKKIAKFYGNIYTCNFLEKFCPFFGEKFCTVQKKSRFFTQSIAEKYSMQKLPQKFAKKFTKK